MYEMDKIYKWFSRIVNIDNCFPLKHIVIVKSMLDILQMKYNGHNQEEHRHLVGQIQAAVKQILDIPVRAYGGIAPEEKMRMIREVKIGIKKLLEFYRQLGLP